MINAFAINDSRLLRIDDEPADLSSAIWLDLLEPTGEEREMLQEGLGQSLASFLELEDIEASARFFEDEDGLHLHSFFYCEDEENYADLASVAFTIRDGRLFTLRDRELPAFRLYRMRSRSQRLFECNAYEVLLDLFETKIEQLADVIKDSLCGCKDSISRKISRACSNWFGGKRVLRTKKPNARCVSIKHKRTLELVSSCSVKVFKASSKASSCVPFKITRLNFSKSA